MTTSKAVTSKECRFATYVPPPEHGMPDMHVVKEVVHYDDGTIEPHVHLIKDYKRPFWVTQKGYQNHQQKKEWEDETKVMRGDSTQTQLCDNAARLLGQGWFKGDLRKLAESPYLYGTDISSTAVLKKAYQEKYPIQMTKFTVGVFDTETDVVFNTNEIIMATFSCGNVCHTAVVRWFLEGISNPEAAVEAAMQKYLGDVVEKRGIKATFEIVENAAEATISCFKVAHRVKPDFLAIWNMKFDVSKILDACHKYGYTPEEIFSDPDVPKEYRYFVFKEGKTQKVTASGKMTPIKPAAQWHVLRCSASFFVTDAMCVYKQVRTGKPEEQSYSLDAILNKNLGIRKLKFEEADHITNGLKWHEFMQTKFKIEYIIYNRFDCISMEMLDEKTQDLSMSMPLFSGVSDFTTFNSQPKRTIDRLHFYVQEKGKVMGSTASEMKGEMDDETYDLTDWIVALPAERVHDNGICLIQEDPSLRTNIRTHTGDLDVSASYPNGECTINISKETTCKEFVAAEGIEEEIMRMQGINLSGSHSNAAEFCQTLFNCPQFFKLLDIFNEQLVTGELQ